MEVLKKVFLTTALLSVSLFANDTQTILNENGCFSCHAIATKKAAPAFSGVARRNQRFNGAGAKEAIMYSIKNGSQGKYRHFAGSKMPAFSHLTQEELSSVADFILAQASKGGNCRGGNGHKMGMGMHRGGM